MKPLTIQRRKLKWAKSEISESLIDHKNRLEQHGNTCLFPVDMGGTLCGKKSVNCHAIPEAKVLKGILREGKTVKVGVFRLCLDQWRDVLMKDEMNVPSSWGPVELPTGKATAASFACRDHDQAFSAIDVAHPDADDPYSSFMLAYRSLLYVADQVRQSGSVFDQPFFQREVLRINKRPIRAGFFVNRERIAAASNVLGDLVA